MKNILSSSWIGCGWSGINQKKIHLIFIWAIIIGRDRTYDSEAYAAHGIRDTRDCESKKKSVNGFRFSDPWLTGEGMFKQEIFSCSVVYTRKILFEKLNKIRTTLCSVSIKTYVIAF